MGVLQRGRGLSKHFADFYLLRIAAAGRSVYADINTPLSLLSEIGFSSALLAGRL